MGRKFFPSEKGNMVLTRSKDKKIISLTNFDPWDDHNKYFKISAWTIKLKKFTSMDNFEMLQNSMNRYYNKVKNTFDDLIEVSFVGGSRFVQLIYLETVVRDLK
jgi:hypothetical protein